MKGSNAMDLLYLSIVLLIYHYYILFHYFFSHQKNKDDIYNDFMNQIFELGPFISTHLVLSNFYANVLRRVF